MNDEIAKLIIDRTIKNIGLIDVEKADFLRYFSWIFEDEISEATQDRISELINEWD